MRFHYNPPKIPWYLRVFYTNNPVTGKQQTNELNWDSSTDSRLVWKGMLPWKDAIAIRYELQRGGRESLYAVWERQDVFYLHFWFSFFFFFSICIHGVAQEERIGSATIIFQFRKSSPNFPQWRFELLVSSLGSDSPVSGAPWRTAGKRSLNLSFPLGDPLKILQILLRRYLRAFF